MKKVTIIYGAPGTGKTKLAMELLNKFALVNTKVLNGRNVSNETFPFQNCDEDTAVILIDDLSCGDFLIGLVYMDASGIEIERLNRPKITINPDIIITTDNFSTDDFKQLGASFLRRVNLINLDTICTPS